MYLGYASVSNLYMFLCGYEYSQEQLNIPLGEAEAEFQEFQPWLQERFDVKTSASWARIILLYAVNEEEGFNTFFELLEEFKRDRAINPANRESRNRVSTTIYATSPKI